jgi:hypothetical protein
MNALTREPPRQQATLFLATLIWVVLTMGIAKVHKESKHG